jgi:hypothetical protein
MRAPVVNPSGQHHAQMTRPERSPGPTGNTAPGEKSPGAFSQPAKLNIYEKRQSIIIQHGTGSLSAANRT